MKFRFTFRGLFVVITIVALIAMYLGRIERLGDEEERFHRTIGFVSRIASWLAEEYWCDEQLPDNLNLRALVNKYDSEQTATGPVKDFWGKELHVEMFNNATFALVYSEGENRMDERGQGDDLRFYVCMIHDGPRQCNCANSKDHEYVTRYAQNYAKLNPGCTKTINP